MTKEELKEHCKKTVETQLRYKNSINGLQNFHSKRVLEEHQLILDLIEQDAKWLSVIEKIRTKLHEDITYISDINGGWYELSEKGAIERVDNAIDQAIKECDT